jgi:hypothetical protein
MADEEKKMVVAYVPFKTFLAAIEGFERHMPTPIDPSVFPTYSGAIKGQLIGALRFLGLIDEKGIPSAQLKSLVHDKINRKAQFRKILEGAYKPVISAGLDQISPRVFDELMSAYGMSGETHRKVTSFFIQAAKYAEIPMSPLLQKKARAGVTKKRKANEGQEDEGDDNSARGSDGPVKGHTRTVELRDGGRLTLILSVNLFDLVGEERDFVFGLIDHCNDYERILGRKAKP